MDRILTDLYALASSWMPEDDHPNVYGPNQAKLECAMELRRYLLSLEHELLRNTKA